MMTTPSVISGFRHSVSFSIFWYVSHSRLVVADVSVHHKGFLFKRPWQLNMGPIGCHETSVANYQSSLRNIPEDQRSTLFRDLRKAFTMKTLTSVVMLHTVNFTGSFVCDLKPCLAYYFEGGNVSLLERRLLTGSTPILLKRDQWIISTKGRKTDMEKPKHSQKRKPVCHPFQQNFYMDCYGMKSRLLQWKLLTILPEPRGLRFPVTLRYSVVEWTEVE
jgi:uncharacterized membrane protein